jgi:hypothetical protein
VGTAAEEPPPKSRRRPGISIAEGNASYYLNTCPPEELADLQKQADAAGEKIIPFTAKILLDREKDIK